MNVKRSIILAALVLLTATATLAQNPQLERYAGKEGMTYVFVSSALLQLLPADANFNANGVKFSDIRDQTSSLQVVAANNPETSRQLRR